MEKNCNTCALFSRCVKVYSGAVSICENYQQFETVKEVKEAGCIGKIYRFRKSAFSTKAGYSERIDFVLLKTLSCKGCKYCNGLLEYVSDCYCGEDLIYDDKLENGDKCILYVEDDGYFEFRKLDKGK